MKAQKARRNFTGILTVSTGLVLTLFLAACTPTENANLTAGNGETATLPEAGDTNDSATVKEDGGEEILGVDYTLPEGWNQKSEPDDLLKSAYREETNPDFQDEPFSKIEFAKPERGTTQNALEIICPKENQNNGNCDYASNENYEIREVKIGEYTVFVMSSKGIHGGENLWQNVIAFQKEGIVYKVTFTGYKLDEYGEELDLIVKTIRAVE